MPEVPVTDPPASPTIPEGYVPKERYDELDEKYKNSSSEALILREQLKQHEDSRRELTNEPAESDLRAAFPEIDWDYADPATKRLARETFLSRRATDAILRKEQEREDAARRNTDLELVIAKNPSLLGKEQAFKDFANMPTHRSAPIEVLVDAFLHKNGATPSPTDLKPLPTLEPGNGGPRGPISTKLKYSAEEMRDIQTSDPRRYREMLLNGDFDD